jgi:MinD superfamily P-loop ATPase
MTTIAVASGKGGTGKTTIATSLVLSAPELRPVFLDCDVEAPNAHLYLHPHFDKKFVVAIPVPQIDESACSSCGLCAQVCQYNAIAVLGGKVQVFRELCHGCGSCARQCPEGAIREVDQPVGCVQTGTSPNGQRFGRGLLDIGQAMPVPVIRALKRWQGESSGRLVVRDSPPGTACPMVETLRGADYVLLVTEPTPFGLHDLKLALEVTRMLGLPAGVLVNRSGAGNPGMEEVCQEYGVPVLMRVPLRREFGEALARGLPLVEAFPEFRLRFRELLASILHQIKLERRASRSLEGSEPHDIGLDGDR